MTTAEMLAVLGHRLEDPSGDLFSTTEKLLFLNIAQDKLVQFLNPHLLTDLHVIDAGVSLTTDGEIPVDFKEFLNPVGITATPLVNVTTITSTASTVGAMAQLIDSQSRWITNGFKVGMPIKLTKLSGSEDNSGTYVVSIVTSDVLHLSSWDDLTSEIAGDNITVEQIGLVGVPFGGPMGIMGLRQPGSNFIRKVSWDMIKDSVTGYTSFTSTEPVYFVFKNRLYIYNHTGSVDVYYMRQPTAMEEEVDSDLNSIFHDALVEMAEAELWRTVNDETRMATAQTRGMAMISQHNSHSVTGVIGEGIPFDYSSSNSLVDPIYPPYPSSG